MLEYEKKAGVIAEAYALAYSVELPHFDKNAQFIETWFSELLFSVGTESQKAVCEGNLKSFSLRFAARAFDRKSNVEVLLDDDVFSCMCYIFVVLTFTKGFSIDGSLHGKASSAAAKLELSVPEMLWFFKKVIDDLWAMHTQSAPADKQALQSA